MARRLVLKATNLARHCPLRGSRSASGYLGSVRYLLLSERFILSRVSDEKVHLVC